MPELLLELRSEEIPARMQARAADDLRRLVTERLAAAGLTFGDARAYATPRRLALVVAGLPAKQPDVTEERRGPRADAPEQAIRGFLAANGLSSVKQAELRETEKGAFYFAVRRVKGKATAAVLPEVVAGAVHALAWPKSMRWIHGPFRWVRPLHGVLAVFGGKPLPGALPLGNGAALDFGNATLGHRFLAPKAFKVRGFADYQAKLRAAKVILDPAERRAEILRQARRRAARAKLSLPDDPALLDEVTGLVEWPVVLIGRIDDAFMDLPPEVLSTAMRAHQRYLALRDSRGRLANRFLMVANMETADKGRTIVAGNERVLRARLADARFFWDQDRRRTLESRVPALGDMVFHARLGSLRDKVDRMVGLIPHLARFVPGVDAALAERAALLAKADLTTGMVGEFPELQGVMGRYYALAEGARAEVAEAVAEHYAPQGPNDRCPSAPLSVAVALADKIDTLVGFFAIGETPTGSKDPYALRRAALGVIRLIVENRLRVPLTSAFVEARRLYDEKLVGDSDQAGLVAQLLDFFADRLKVALRDKGVRHDLISAVFALGGEDDLVRLLARVDALQAFLGTDDGANLLVAYRRAANIVRIEEKRDGATYDGAVEPPALHQDEERTLFAALEQAAKASEELLRQEDFTGAMAALAKLRRPVDDFFDHVTVNTEDPALRANRLRLLSRIRATLDRVADFSKIEG